MTAIAPTMASSDGANAWTSGKIKANTMGADSTGALKTIERHNIRGREAKTPLCVAQSTPNISMIRPRRNAITAIRPANATKMNQIPTNCIKPTAAGENTREHPPMSYAVGERAPNESVLRCCWAAAPGGLPKGMFLRGCVCGTQMDLVASPSYLVVTPGPSSTYT